MYGINTLPYYTSTSMTPRGYAHGGIANTRQGYLFGGLTRTISKALGKIIPNEVKPFLPYIAAIAPFTGVFGSLAGAMPGFGLTGPALELAQRGILGAGINAASQMSQKDFNQRGFNPISSLLAAGTAGLSGPSAGEFLGGLRPAEVGIETGAPSSFLDTVKNSALDVAKQSSEFLNKGRTADLFSMDFAKAAAVPITTAATEQAYNKAKDALDKYNAEQGAIGAMGVADQSKRKDAVIHAMQLAGFDQTGIDSALSRLGLADGGSTTMPKFIPMDPESVGLRLFGKNIDSLSYIEKQAVRDYIDDNKNKKADGGLMSLKGNEMDFRDGGGFVPIGKKERADDVPARLSKNEFVFTAKAVRNAGHGDTKAGAKRMYQLMKHLEAK